MSLPPEAEWEFDPEQIQEILQHLEQAIRDHHEWLMLWHRSIICRTPLNAEHLADDAHLHCRFGQWYYGEENSFLHRFEAFDAIHPIHRDMHAVARYLADHSLDGDSVTPREYDAFLELRGAFREQVRILDKNLQDLLLHTDPLTRVQNRTRLLPVLRREQERVVNHREQCAIGMMDLDNFKAINDTHGHPAGDQVLREIARHISTHLRTSEYIFRYGGEEFLFCLPDTRLLVAHRVIDRLRQGIAELPILLDSGLTLRITASFGLTSLSSENTVEESIAHADEALYLAKKSGKNRVCVWSAP